MRKIILIIAMIIAISMSQMAKDKTQFAQVVKIDTSMTEQVTGVVDSREIYPSSIEISKEEFDEICRYMIKDDPYIETPIRKFRFVGWLGVHAAEVIGTNRELKYTFRSYVSGEVIDIRGDANYYEVYLKAEEAYRYWIEDQKYYKGKEQDLELNMKRILFFRHMSYFWIRLNRQ